jgi:predicted dehydrogenase
MPKLKIAFAGFRHGHIISLYDLARARDDLEVVAACEEHAPTRAQLERSGRVQITHDQLEALLDVESDIIAIGDYFTRRGPVALRALERGRHVIVDKPLCTQMEYLDQIAALTTDTKLKVGCMLTMRDAAQTLAARQLIGDGRIGEVHAISFGGQHPLLLGSRPAWYFEEGKHGGTITDIAIHAIDALPWVTGLRFETIHAARCWNAFASDTPHFEDAGQMMLKMDNGCGILGDVSYFAPDRAGYSMPYYWRITYWGRDGVIETSSTVDHLQLLCKDDEAPQEIPLPPSQSGGYLQAFLDDIAGIVPTNGLDTETVLHSARQVIRIQQAADRGEREVSF